MLPQFNPRPPAKRPERNPLPSLTPEQVGALLLRQRCIDRVTGCWLWTGNQGTRGYGRLCLQGRVYLVHRLSAYAFQGYDLAAPTSILHSCDRPPCFNPDHLRAGDQYDNWRDRAQRRQQPPRYKADLTVVYTLADAGWSQKRIGDHLGVSQPAVWRYLKMRRAVPTPDVSEAEDAATRSWILTDANGYLVDPTILESWIAICTVPEPTPAAPVPIWDLVMARRRAAASRLEPEWGRAAVCICPHCGTAHTHAPPGRST